jgi:EAL domain-containing protein (putative c-di-GMP-specific phosphodiesterase class I)
MMSSARRKAAPFPNPDVPAPRWQATTPGQLQPDLQPIPGMAPGMVPHGSRSIAARRLRQEVVTTVLSTGGPRIVYQPQLSLTRMELAGYEALARFPGASPGESVRGTHTWFAMAHDVGLGDELEAIALRRALLGRDRRPAGTSLAVNLSPSALTAPVVADALPDDLDGLEVELTEHEWAPGVGRLRRELDRLRERGARIAIDDIGVAHSGLRRVMDLAPDRIKLDRHLVQGLSTDGTKTALIRSVVDFAEHIGADVCAEGVETLDDLEALAELDVGYAQGWAIGMPDQTFTDVDPAAVTASRDNHRRLLASPVPATYQHDAAIGVEHLLSRLASVTTLECLHRLTAGYAGVLGSDLVEISVLTPDGAALHEITASPGTGPVFRLSDYPITRQALQSRTIAPVHLDGGGPDGGDQAEWEVLRQLGMESALMVPVISRDVPIGLLECYSETSQRWTRRQVRSARTVAAMLGPVLDVLLRGPQTPRTFSN